MEWQMKMQGLDNPAIWDAEPRGRLLVIDDDPFLRATLKEQFAAEGFEDVSEAENLFEAFREVDDKNPCLLYTSPSPRDGLLSRMPSSA